MTPETRLALERARHALASLSGLVAFDGAAPAETWTIDERATIAEIDAVLGAGPSGWLLPTKEPTHS